MKYKMLSRVFYVIVLCFIVNFINFVDRVIMFIVIVFMVDEYKWDLYG